MKFNELEQHKASFFSLPVFRFKLTAGAVFTEMQACLQSVSAAFFRDLYLEMRVLQIQILFRYQHKEI